MSGIFKGSFQFRSRLGSIKELSGRGRRVIGQVSWKEVRMYSCILESATLRRFYGSEMPTQVKGAKRSNDLDLNCYEEMKVISCSRNSMT